MKGLAPMTGRGRRRADRGFALISVVLITAMLALIAGAASLTARAMATAQRVNSDMLLARTLAESGVSIALHDLTRKENPVFARDGRTYEFEVEGGVISVAIEDEAGKIDVNHAPYALVKALFLNIGREAGLDAFAAVNLAELTVGSLSKEGERRSDARRLTSVAALRGIEGMTEPMFQALEPHVTVLSIEGKVNPLTATPAALAAIPGVDAAAISRLIAARRPGVPRPAVDRAESYFTTLNGPAFTIRAIGRRPNGVSARMSVVVAATGVSATSGRNNIVILEQR